MSICDVAPSTEAVARHPAPADDVMQRQNAALRLKITRLEEALRAILGDEVDALFVGDDGNRRMFTLDGADRPYRALIEAMGEGALTLTRDGVVAYANRRFAELLGRPLQQVIGSHIEDAVAPEGRMALGALLRNVTPAKQIAELDLFAPEGLRVAVLVSVSPLSIDGLPGAIGMVVTDLTWQRRSEAAVAARLVLQQLVEQQQRVEASLQDSLAARYEAEAQLLLAGKLFEQSSEGFIVTDAQGDIVKVNQAFTAICGYTEADALGQNPRMLASGRHDAAFFQSMWSELADRGHWRGEVWNRRKDGSVYPQWLSMSRVIDAVGQATHYIAAFSDITQRKEAEDSIRRLAHFDPLTGLPNRALLSDRATHALQMSRRSNEPMALMFIDLDHFKNVNDTLGHDVGDRLLVAVTKRFNAALRDQDTLSRTGGDEFVLLLPGTDSAGSAHVAQKLLLLARQPYQIDGHELNITPSIGVALFPSDGGDYGALAKCADAAMYLAKQGGRNTFCFYTAEVQARSARMLLLENALRRALERGELQLHYQPQRSLQDQTVIGAEALLRWQHPELGWVEPTEFIPIAESSGLIMSIGEWVLRTALAQLKAWMDNGMAPITMAVNISAVQFRQRSLPDLVSASLAASGVAAQWLELELTESVASEDPTSAIAVIRGLRAFGVRTSIDDFGTGYSSLSYLKQFKVSKLKIDQSFVHSVTHDADDQAIVSAIINMAKSLGLRTIAEGVETEGQLEYLREQGCDEMQGYWFSRPLSADRFEAFVKTCVAKA
jgi:diguanylate cyclase (GGDEF)-like protein/PAS domain S-box-containing protein